MKTQNFEEQVNKLTNQLIEEASVLTEDPLLCTRLAIYMNSTGADEIMTTGFFIDEEASLDVPCRKKVSSYLDDREELRAMVYAELIKRYESLENGNN